MVNGWGQEFGQTRRTPVGKRQRLHHERPVHICGVKILQEKLVCSTAPHLNRQGPGRLILREREIRMRDPRPKLNPVAFTRPSRILDRVDPVTDIEQIGVVAGTSAQRIVALPSGKGISPVASTEVIVASQTDETVGGVRPGEHIIPAGSRYIKP